MIFFANISYCYVSTLLCCAVSLNFSATYMTGANLPDVFSIVNAHFHWGSDSNVGSEHTLDGVRYPLEVCITQTIFDMY